jgi:hypothetical protein
VCTECNAGKLDSLIAFMLASFIVPPFTSTEGAWTPSSLATRDARPRRIIRVRAFDPDPDGLRYKAADDVVGFIFTFTFEIKLGLTAKFLEPMLSAPTSSIYQQGRSISACLLCSNEHFQIKAVHVSN